MEKLSKQKHPSSQSAPHTLSHDQLNWIRVNYRVALESGFQFSSWHDYKGELWLDTYLRGTKTNKKECIPHQWIIHLSFNQNQSFKKVPLDLLQLHDRQLSLFSSYSWCVWKFILKRTIENTKQFSDIFWSTLHHIREQDYLKIELGRQQGPLALLHHKHISSNMDGRMDGENIKKLWFEMFMWP